MGLTLVGRFGSRRLLASVSAIAVSLAISAAVVHGQVSAPVAGGLRPGFDENLAPEVTRAPVLDAYGSRVFRAPNAGSFPQRFGNSAGSGAGTTGFVSTNVRRAQVNALRNGRAAVRTGTPARPGAAGTGSTGTLPPSGAGAAGGAQAGATPAGTPSTNAPATQGTGAPGETALGIRRPRRNTLAAITLLSPPTGAGYTVQGPIALTLATPPVPPRRAIVVEADPFAPTGVHAGTFYAFPALELFGGYNSNPSRFVGKGGSGVGIVAPELAVRSDWSRHALSLDLRGSYTAFESAPGANRPFLDARLGGRIDVTNQTRIDLEGRYFLDTVFPNSPDLQAGFARLPIFTDTGTTLGISHRFNRLEISGKATYDRIDFQNTELIGGGFSSNRDRNYDQYGAQLRAAYELTPGLRPFAEAAVDQRIRDLAVDFFGYRRSSEGVLGRAGSTFEIGPKLTGEAAVGYVVRDYKDPRLPNLQGVTVDGSLIWQASALTNARVTLATTTAETTLPGVSGVLRRDVGLQIDHAFRRWLIASASVGYGTDEYQGSNRLDERYSAAVAVIYKLNREVQIKAQLRQDWLKSNLPGWDYTTRVALIGMRLQR